MARPRIYWICVRTRKWHAWTTGGRRSSCTHVTLDDLEQYPATAVHRSAPTAKMLPDLCRVCARKHHVSITSTAAPLPAHAAAWLGYLKRHVTHERLTVAQCDLAKLALLLEEVGPPNDCDALQVFAHIRTLMLTPQRYATRRGARRAIPKLQQTLQHLRPNTQALVRIAKAMTCWQTVTGRNVMAERFSPARVVEVILQVPAPAPYIQHLQERGFSHFGAVFHPNTLARAQTEASLRGVFGGSGDYWEQTRGQLQVIE